MTPGDPPEPAANDRMPPQGGTSRGVRWIVGFAAGVSLVMAVSPPLGYFLLSHQAERRESAIAARLHAAFLTQVVLQSVRTWQLDIEGLIDSELAPGQLPERRIVRDTTGRVVSSTGPVLQPPLITSQTALLGTDGPVGEVVVERSTRPLVNVALLIALASFSLAAATFAALVTFPLRALRSTIAAVRREESQIRARAQAEENLRVVFEHSEEGILMFDGLGRIVSSNPASQTLLGGGRALPLEGEPVQRWFQPVQGSCEVLAVGPDNRELSLEVTVTASKVGEQTQWVAIIRDVTERRQHERRLAEMATVDSLTGLPNRAMFRILLQQAIDDARVKHRCFALMFLDLDRFKFINDTLGHDAGDQLLRQVAQRLNRAVRPDGVPAANGPAASAGVVFRLGGDEFTILLREVAEPDAARAVALRVLDAIALPVLIGSEQLSISTSIGIAIGPTDGVDADGLVKQADVAMYRAKAQGRSRFCVFGQDVFDAADEGSAPDSTGRVTQELLAPGA